MHNLLWFFGDIAEVTRPTTTMLRDLIFRDGDEGSNQTTIDTAYALALRGRLRARSRLVVTPAGAGLHRRARQQGSSGDSSR